MPRTILSDAELIGLLRNVVNRGGAELLTNWFRYIDDTHIEANSVFNEARLNGNQVYLYKDLGYKDFRIRIQYFALSGDSVSEFTIQFWRPTKFRIFDKSNEKLVGIIIETLNQRYTSFLSPRPKFKFIKTKWCLCYHYGYMEEQNDPCDFEAWRSESLVIYEPSSEGQGLGGAASPTNDFIIFRWFRRYQPAI